MTLKIGNTPFKEKTKLDSLVDNKKSCPHTNVCIHNVFGILPTGRGKASFLQGKKVRMSQNSRAPGAIGRGSQNHKCH